MGRRYLVLGAVTAGWGTIPVLAGWSQLPAAIIVAFRLWSGAICLGLVLVVQGRYRRRVPGVGASGPPRLLSYRPARCCLTGAVLGLHWLALFAAYERTPAGTVILVVYLAPIGVVALAPRLLGERLNRWTIVTLMGALGGLVLLAVPTLHGADASGLALSLLASVLFVALIMLSKSLAPVYGGLRLAFVELTGASLLVVPVALATRWPTFGHSWYWVIVLGVVHTALGITLYLSVLADIPATHVGILSYLEPVVVVLVAWLWLGQRPTVAMALGGASVVAAGIVLAVTSVTPGGAGGSRRPASVPADPAIPSR